MSRIVLSSFVALMLGLSPGPGTPPAQAAEPSYPGSSFDQVWSQVASDPYLVPPDDPVTVTSFFGFFTDHLLAAARRTLDTHADLLPWFRKLVHPNGICFAGVWRITEDNPWTGYFRPGSEGLVIARASTALTSKRRGQFRAFGLAVKLFPTMDPEAVVRTANIFTIENLGGTLRDYFLDAENTNDILLVAPTPEAASHAAAGAVAAKDFAIADGTLDPTQPLIRQLYPVAELGGEPSETARAPTWIMFTGAPDVPRVVADDYREELRLANYPGGLRFDIYASDWGTRIGPKIWQRIGEIELHADALSDSCDHRLHFHHPRFRR